MNESCQTDFGKFRIKIDKENIKVGGRNFCVNLALYEKETWIWPGAVDSSIITELKKSSGARPKSTKLYINAFSGPAESKLGTKQTVTVQDIPVVLHILMSLT